MEVRLESLKPDRVLDCYGLLCPVPVRKTAQALQEIRVGQVLQVISTDDWFGPDLEAWLRDHPHQRLLEKKIGSEIHVYLRKA